MQQLYQKVNLENLDLIRQEVLTYYKENPPILREDHEVFLDVPVEALPVTRATLNKRTRTEIVEHTACFVPPGITTYTHIDGVRRKGDLDKEWADYWVEHVKDKNITGRNSNDDDFFCNQWTLIIPISGYEDSVNCWYDNNDVSIANERVSFNHRSQWPYRFFVSCVQDGANLEPIAKVVIDAPTIIRSNLYHNVDNTKNKETRLVLVVRFIEHKDGMEVDDYLACKDILI